MNGGKKIERGERGSLSTAEIKGAWCSLLVIGRARVVVTAFYAVQFAQLIVERPSDRRCVGPDVGRAGSDQVWERIS